MVSRRPVKDARAIQVQERSSPVLGNVRAAGGGFGVGVGAAIFAGKVWAWANASTASWVVQLFSKPLGIAAPGWPALTLCRNSHGLSAARVPTYSGSFSLPKLSLVPSAPWQAAHVPSYTCFP